MIQTHAAAIILAFLLCGCGGSAETPREDPKAVAKRVFSLAKEFERAQEPRKAMDAYRQVVSHFPGTPEAKLAAERIARAQRESLGKSRKSKAKGAAKSTPKSG